MNWPMVKLGDLLTKSEDWITLHPDRKYKEVTVRLWGNGTVLRKEILGAEIASTSRLRVRANQFILSRIDARNGAYGLIPPELDGAVVSNDFPVFDPNPERLDANYLRWLSRTKPFVAFCTAASEGTTNRVRLKEDRFLATEISLPPLAEQRRLVARIDALAAKIDEAKRLWTETDEGIDKLCRSFFRDADDNPLTPTPMSELVRLREPDVTVDTNQQYHFAGVYCFGRGVFVGQRKTGMEFKYPRLTTLRTGNFVYPKLMAWEGALAVVPPECNGLVVSTEFPVFEIDTNKVLPEVLDTFFRSPNVWPELSGTSTGTNMRRQRLNPADFLKYKFPLPAMLAQERLSEIKLRGAEIAAHRESTTPALNAMLPAILDRAFRGEL